MPMNHRNSDNSSKSLEITSDQRSIGPWTRVGYVKVVAVGFCWKSGIRLVTDEITKHGRSSFVGSVVRRKCENFDRL
jgi:hypothetical protein